MEATVPLLPCTSLEDTLHFYRALGCEINHEQTSPYLYGAVRRGTIDLHFSRLSMYGAKIAFGASLVFVPEVGSLHRAFADNLRSAYGTIPTAGCPRLTRFREGDTRFQVFDPSGNMLIFIDQNEKEVDAWESGEALSELGRALENAVFLRDIYANDSAAARVLDAALADYKAEAPLERALTLAARAELAVALGEVEQAESARSLLRQISLSDEQRERFRHELMAADELKRWITGVDHIGD